MVFYIVVFIVVVSIAVIAFVTSKEDVGGDGKRHNTEQPEAKDDGLSLKDKLILGAGAAKLLEMEEEHYQQRKREREQKRLDELNWQDAARRKDPFGNDDSSENW